ncbi:MAG: hypothetical protein ACTHVE_05240, partial [Senegalia sp. (in: firmicutes)]
MKKKKKKFKIKYILMLVLVVYLASIFIRQEFEINNLDSNIKKEQNEKQELEKFIEDKGKKAEYLNKISSA